MLRKRNTHKKRITPLFMILIMIMSLHGWNNNIVFAEDDGFEKAPIDLDELESEIMAVVDWKKEELQSPDGLLLTNDFLENAGETSADWYVIGLGRTGVADNFADYTAVIKDDVEKRYQTEEKLSDAKATEWHRISLAILAAGGDPTKVGESENGEAIDLIADGTYYRGKDTRPLGTQGINGWIWGLITIDSMRYDIPDDAVETRDSIIQEILRSQLDDGGFALNTFEEDADVDLTAMAIQALAPYYNSEETYTYEQTTTGKEVTNTVRDVVDEAVELLSALQSDNADYDMAGISNVESTSQVIVALTALGIDPLADERFIKNGNTLLDAILAYKMPDGGFIHSETYDEENEFADPDESNSMASEQVLYTLTALYRFYDGKRSLYDFREEMSEEAKEKIKTTTKAIAAIPDDSDNKDELKKAFKLYEEVPVTERSYVYNYAKLADAMAKENIENTSESIAEHMGQNENGKGYNPPLFESEESDTEDEMFTEKDEQKAVSLLNEPISTEYHVEVTALIDKIQNQDAKDEHEAMLVELEELKSAIEDEQAEIDQVNQLILDELYPFSTVTKDDKSTVDEIMKRYEALESYDKEKVQDYEAVEKAATQIDNTSRATYITVGVIIVIAVMLLTLVVRHKKRKKAKEKEQMMDMAE